jgi:hypothetical protein
MRISTIIPAYNCEPYLRRAVESLLATNYPDLEIAVVDDGSHDGTLDMALTLQREHPDVLRVLTHAGHANRGVSASRNLGIESTSGELIAFLDADDYVYPWRFDSASAILSTHPQFDAVYQTCEMVYADERSRSQWWDQKPLFGLDQALSGRHELLCSLLNARTWSTGAIVCRRRLIERVGGFHTGLRIAEDCHMWLRMAYAGQIVPGDFTRPVSTYVRRQGSAYQPNPAHRVQMVRAIADFYYWTMRFDANKVLQRQICHAACDYICRGLENLRTQGQIAAATRFATQCTRYFPPVLRSRRFWGNCARIPFHVCPLR